MHRVLRQFLKNRKILSIFALSSTLYLSHQYFSIQTSPIKCFQISNKNTSSHEAFSFQKLETDMIRIQNLKGELICYGYCFQEDFLVAPKKQMQNYKKGQMCKFIRNNSIIQSQYRVIGEYEHLIFLKIIPKGNNSLQPFINSNHRNSQFDRYGEVQIVNKQQHYSIKNGFYVGKDCGYSLVQGEGQIGSLIVKNSEVAGIVVQIGHKDESGYLRVLGWSNLKSVLRLIQTPNSLYLGISTAHLQEREGLSIARVSSDSPFKGSLSLGDIIIKANGMNVHTSDDLLRIAMLANGQLVLQVQREGQLREAYAKI